MKVKIWLAWRKLNGAAGGGVLEKLPATLSPRLEPIFSRENVGGKTIAWAAPCVSGRGSRIPANLFGALIATNDEPHRVMFVGHKGRRSYVRKIDLEDLTAVHEPKFLSENLILFPAAGKGPKYSFIFPRSDAALVEEIVGKLRGPALQEQMTAESMSPLG
jgi:hypothetical protein